MIPSQASTPPAHRRPALRTPRMYPIPMYSGVMSPATVAAGKMRLFALETHSGDSAITPRTFWRIAYANANPRPAYAVRASAPPFSPAMSTCAHAVPSGYASVPCSFTMSARRSGIIMRMPRTPPSTASVRIVP